MRDAGCGMGHGVPALPDAVGQHLGRLGRVERPQDRKSTRLNSSHLVISYAVFCLKKKNIQETRFALRQRTDELATQNAELSVARNTAVGLARVRELHELVRVVYESSKNSRALERV